MRDLLPIKLGADLGMDEGRQTSTSNIKSNGDETGSPGNMGRDAEQNGEYPEIFTALRTSFLRAFNVMDRDLKLHKSIDCFFSGTTAVAVLKQVIERNPYLILFYRNPYCWFHSVEKLLKVHAGILIVFSYSC